MIVEEGLLRFDFDNHHWQVIKFDEHTDYQKMQKCLSATKAVDFVGVLNKTSLYFIEVKDFRGYTVQNKKRLLTDELAVEIAQKVKDSVACLLGSHRTSSKAEDWKLFVQALLKNEIKVILWLEHDLPTYKTKKDKVFASVEGNVLKTKLKWLTTKATVMSQDHASLSHLTISNLPKS